MLNQMLQNFKSISESILGRFPLNFAGSGGYNSTEYLSSFPRLFFFYLNLIAGTVKLPSKYKLPGLYTNI